MMRAGSTSQAVAPKLPKVLYGLNVSKRKFYAWIQYTLHHEYHLSKQVIAQELAKFKHTHTSTRKFDLENSLPLRKWLRGQWKARWLVSERTESLSLYASDGETTATTTSKTTNGASSVESKRGGFGDLLTLYTERVLGIVQDELDQTNGDEDTSLLAWLERHYGVVQIAKLKGPGRNGIFWPFMKEADKLQEIQLFLNWFREHFPYYYDRCDFCGSSERDEESAGTTMLCQDGLQGLMATANGSNEDDEENNDVEESSFLGYVYPTTQELTGKASRTELYLCQQCGNVTRFPRFNAATRILETNRGRCGEYSMLLYRILRALGHESRWVVDWADHVWCEISVGKQPNAPKWIHLDPCEAAVDKPLLYQEWGKTQTHIVAFYAPSLSTLRQQQHQKQNHKQVLIHDVTQNYTSDSMEVLGRRREESAAEIETCIQKASDTLQDRLTKLMH